MNLPHTATAPGRWPQLAVAALLALAGCATGPAIPDGTPIPGAPATAPVEKIEGLLRTQVDVMAADGRWRPTWVVLDLGSTHPMTATADVLAWALPAPGLTPEAPRRFQNARGDILESRGVVLEGVRFAGVEWRGLPASEAVWHPDYPPPVRTGVVGWPLLRDFRVTLDVSARRMALQPGGGSCDGGHLLTADGRGLTVRVTVGGRDVTAILDTAATGTIVTDKSLAGSGPVQLGGKTVDVGHIHHVSLDGLPAPMLLGVPFFEAHRVTIDARAGCLWVSPASAVVAPAQ